MEGFERNLRCAQCNQVRHIYDLTLCSGCPKDEDGTRDYLCSSHCFWPDCGHAKNCSQPTHSDCYTKHASGFAGRLREKHQKSSALDDGFIQVIMPPKVDDQTQKRLHEADREAEWFRISLASSTPQGTMPVLHISNRFKKICDPGGGNYWRSKQYPSFVSFIGDTGAGKSTLVRAMIIVGAIEKMEKPGEGIDFAEVFRCQRHGPVPRSKNFQNSLRPTSNGVHLYRDQTESTGRSGVTPILYADCEGFGAGSMISDAERNAATSDTSEAAGTRRRSGSIDSNSSQRTRITVSSWHSTPSNGPQSEASAHPDYVENLTIRAPDFQEKGKISADLFYARFLYAFSDVVVFVTHEDQKLKEQLKNLLEWTLSAVKKSIRGNASKTLVVVRNRPSNHSDSFLEPTDLNNELFADFGNIWEHSKPLEDYRSKHNEQYVNRRDMILDTQGYFELFFANVIVCYIPQQDRVPASTIRRQYSRLRKVIVDGTAAAQRDRSISSTKYDVGAMTHLLSRAFEHFANFNEPFDFHAAARKDNPMPVSVPGHIAYLIRHVGCSKAQLERVEIFVAVCLVTYIYRFFDINVQGADEIFDETVKDWCIKGVRTFQRKFQQCALLMGDGTRCINFRYNHPKHCSEGKPKKDKLTLDGTFDASAFEKTEYDVIDGIRRAFIDIYQQAYSSSEHLGYRNKPKLETLCELRAKFLSWERAQQAPSSPTQSIQDRRRTLKADEFVERSQTWLSIKSNMTCFACLQHAPDHFLPCGHGFCGECVKDFGHLVPEHKYHYIFSECVLCGSLPGNWLEQLRTACQAQVPRPSESPKRLTFEATPPTQIVPLDPRCSGIRILTLDGGGVRGIIELAILEKIEKRVNLDLPIRELFDFIVGTSTGGIIALALALDPTNMRLSEVREQFLKLARYTFEKDRFGFDFLRVLDHNAISAFALAFRFVPSRYYSSRLRRSLQLIFPINQPIFGDTTVSGKQRRTRVAVTATEDGEPCIFSNYNRAYHDQNEAEDADLVDLSEHKGFERQNNPEAEARVWEAGMATSAAPGFFRKWGIDDPENRKKTRVPFADGALHSNLPVQAALAEKERIWPEHHRHSRPLDLLLSIGTGKGNFKDPAWFGFAPAGVVDLAKTYIKQIFDTDHVWEDFRKSIQYDPVHHRRLTINLDEKVGLDDWKKMDALYKAVQDAYDSSRAKDSLWDKIDKVAYQLTASLFFFEPDKLEHTANDRTETIRGHIWCRLHGSDAAMRRLVPRIEGFYHREGPLEHPVTLLRLPPGWRQEVVRKEIFAIPCRLGSTKDHGVPQSLLVNLRPPEGAGAPQIWEISGFPLTFDQLKEVMKKRGEK